MVVYGGFFLSLLFFDLAYKFLGLLVPSLELKMLIPKVGQNLNGDVSRLHLRLYGSMAMYKC